MPQPQLEQRVSSIEETFQAFLEAQTELNRKADERNRQSEERNRKADERFERLEKRLDQIAQEQLELSRQSEERNRKADERFERLEKRLDQIGQEQLELNRKSEERWQQSEEWHQQFWKEFRKEANSIRGELAQRLGTIAEDLVAPSVPEILRQIAGCEPGDVELVGVRMRQRHPQDRSKQREIDVLATTQDLALAVEVRRKLRPEDIPDTLHRFEGLREFFLATIGDKALIGAIATLYPDPSIVTHAERQGLIVLGLGEHLMDIKNSEGFEPKHF